MADVRIDDPAGMNLLGLFLAAALRRRAAGRPFALRGTLCVDADGMRAMVRFDDAGATVFRADGPAKTTVSGPLPLLVRALARPSLVTLLRVKVKGSRLFALRAMRLLAP